MEKLKYFLTNPYTWLFIIFIFSLPYILKYMRHFYPEKLQEQMAEEEVCTLEKSKKPEMKRLQKIFQIGTLFSFFVTLLVAYYYQSLEVTKTVFISLMSLVAIYGTVTEYKINKDKTCSHVSVKYYIAMLAIVLVIAFVVILVFKK